MNQQDREYLADLCSKVADIGPMSELRVLANELRRTPDEAEEASELLNRSLDFADEQRALVEREANEWASRFTQARERISDLEQEIAIMRAASQFDQLSVQAILPYVRATRELPGARHRIGMWHDIGKLWDSLPEEWHIAVMSAELPAGWQNGGAQDDEDDEP